MKLNNSKSKISILLIIVFLIPIFSVISNNGTSSSNYLNLDELKLSDDNDSPLISNLVVSDPFLELLDTQTITCIVIDDSIISSVYSVIWFENDIFIAECKMTNLGFDNYQGSWSSLDANLGNYTVNVFAEDEFGNIAKETIIFSVVEKPNIYVESVLANNIYTTLGENSLPEYLQPDDSEQFEQECQTYFDNGNNALQCDPNLPWYSAQGVDQAPSGWSKYDDGNYFGLGTTTAGPTASAIETRPKFHTLRSLYSDHVIDDIQIDITVQPYAAGSNPTLGIFIHNFHLGSWETLDYSVRTSNTNLYLHYNKVHLDDENLEHYLDANGDIELRIYDWANYYVVAWIPNFALGIILAFIFPIPVYGSVAHLSIDRCNARVFYRPDQDMNLDFSSGVLDGTNDYFLYFDGNVVDGTAQINVNGEKICDITSERTLKGELLKFPIYDVHEISISGNYKSINIEYFYLEELRDDLPPIQWISHKNGDYVIFEDALDNTMELEYSCLDGLYDEIRLELLGNEFVTSVGINNIDISSIRSALLSTGIVEAKLLGYKDGVIITDNAFNKMLYFVEITDVYENEVVDSGSEDLGHKLYLILHDPHGDQSFSSFTETTTISIGTKFSLTAGISAGIEIGFDGGIGGGSGNLDVSMECEETYDFRYEVTNVLFLTSMQEEEDNTIIGPGFGDRYWGERWCILWELIADRVVLSNGDEIYLEPNIVYGISRTEEVWENDKYAFPEWKLLNPVHNGYNDVDWRSTFSGHGGLSTYQNTDSVTISNTHSISFNMAISAGVRAKLSYCGFYVEAKVSASLSTTNYADSTQSHTIETSYTIGDDEVDDYMHMEVGIDKNFGTYIFKAYPDSFSSDPVEQYI